MRQVGVRELKEHASEIVRRVREEGESVEILYRGRAVARLVPTIEPASAKRRDTFWQEWEEFAAEVDAHWPDGVTAAEAIAEDRYGY